MRNFVPSTQQFLAVPDVNLSEEKVIREDAKKKIEIFGITTYEFQIPCCSNSLSSVENGSCLSLGIPITNVNLKNSYSFQSLCHISPKIWRIWQRPLLLQVKALWKKSFPSLCAAKAVVYFTFKQSSDTVDVNMALFSTIANLGGLCLNWCSIFTIAFCWYNREGVQLDPVSIVLGFDARSVYDIIFCFCLHSSHFDS